MATGTRWTMGKKFLSVRNGASGPLSLLIKKLNNMEIEKYQNIDSSQNKQIKKLEKLKRKKHRAETGKFVAENLAIIYDALRSGHDFDELYVTKDFVSKHKEKKSSNKRNTTSEKHDYT